MGFVPRHRKFEVGALYDDGRVAIEMVDVSTYGVALECDVCGEAEPVAFWHGQRTISVCKDCATTVLPRLIADAVVSRQIKDPNIRAEARECLRVVEENYQRGIELNVRHFGPKGRTK